MQPWGHARISLEMEPRRRMDINENGRKIKPSDENHNKKETSTNGGKGIKTEKNGTWGVDERKKGRNKRKVTYGLVVSSLSSYRLPRRRRRRGRQTLGTALLRRQAHSRRGPLGLDKGLTLTRRRCWKEREREGEKTVKNRKSGIWNWPAARCGMASGANDEKGQI